MMYPTSTHSWDLLLIQLLAIVFFLFMKLCSCRKEAGGGGEGLASPCSVHRLLSDIPSPRSPQQDNVTKDSGTKYARNLCKWGGGTNRG
jgi:hypothetical protein